MKRVKSDWTLYNVFSTLSSTKLRKIMRHRDNRQHRMMAYGILVERRRNR